MAEPFVIGLLMPFPESERIVNAFRVRPEVEVLWTPYFESQELRTSKGRNRGKDPEGLETPTITPQTRASWARCHAIASMDLPAHPDQLFPELRWFQGMGAGFDHIDTAALARMGVVQTNASGVAATSMAEFVMARLLQEWKALRQLDRQQEQRLWETRFGNELAGRTVGIVGLGALQRRAKNTHVMIVLEHFEVMTIVGTDLVEITRL